MQKQRLTRELSKISSLPPQGISLVPKGDSLSALEASIIGPEGTPYQNGLFKLEVLVPERYPFEPPSIQFTTRVYHPNISDAGTICLDLLKMPPKGSWQPTITIEGVLIAIKMLLETPNPDDPLMPEIAKEYKTLHGEFCKKARGYTQKYAK